MSAQSNGPQAANLEAVDSASDTHQSTAGITAAARDLTAAGMSVLPIMAGISKRPAVRWQEYQQEQPRPDELDRWFAGGHEHGLGVVTGAVSGNLEMSEIEGRALDQYPKIRTRLQAEHPELWEKLQGWAELSPSGGIHWFYRLTGDVEGNRKLAQRPSTDEELAEHVAAERAKLDGVPDENLRQRRAERLDRLTHADVPHVLAETRGEGGFVVVAPTDGSHHETGRPWLRLAGGPEQVLVLSDEERATFHAVLHDELDAMPARERDERPARPAATTAAVRAAEYGPGESPADHFNRVANWVEILTPHGWTLTRTDGDGTRYWLRPGSTGDPGRDHSATTGHKGSNNLYVFSTGTDLPTEEPITPAAFRAHYETGGEFGPMVALLRREGYGAPLPPAEPRPGFITGTGGQAPARGQLAAAPASAEDGDPGPGTVLRRFSDLRVPPPTQWIGPGWLPRREITLLLGEEGLGKSLLWVRLAAAITTGRPDSVFSIPAREPADVVLIITEDTTAEVQARLNVAGADLARVYVFSSEDDGTGSPVFGEHHDEGDYLRLRRYLAADGLDPALIVVDAWLDTVDGKLSIRDTQQARRALHPWKRVAAEHDLAVMLLGHTNRVDTGSTRDRVGGSVALRQKARMVLYATRPGGDDEDDRLRMVVGPEKANTSGKANAVRFDVAVQQVRASTPDDPGTTAHLTGATDMGAPIGELVADWHRAAKVAERTPSKKDACKEAITAYMAGKDSVPVDELDRHLAGLGYGEKVRKAARGAVGWSDRATFGGGYLFRVGPSPYLAGQHAVHPSPNTAQHAPHAPHAPQGRTGVDITKDVFELQAQQAPSQPLPGMPGMPGNRDSNGPRGAPHGAPQANTHGDRRTDERKDR